MIRKPILFLTVFLGFILSGASGQNSQVMYFMNLPQNRTLNPAIRPTSSLYIGLPGLSGTSVNVSNNFLNLSDVLMNGQSSDSIISFIHPDYNPDRFLSRLRDKNSVETQLSIQMLGVGFRIGEKNYVCFDINDRITGNVVLPGDLIKLLLNGNQGYVGKNIDLSALRGDMKYYREVGFGFSRDITDKLRLGVKAKLLFGMADISLKNRSLGMTVNSANSQTLNTDLSVNISAPVTVYVNDNQNIDSMAFDDDRFNSGHGVGRFMMGNGNFGLGLDIGATYEISDKIVVSAAVTDLGYIKWKRDVTNLVARNRIEFTGVSYADYYNGTKTLKEVGDELADTLKNSFKVSETNDPYTTYIPFGFTAGGSYSLNKYISVGLLSYSRVIGKQVREELTLSGNFNLGNSISTSLSYSLANHRADNLGTGLAFRAGIVQFYTVADRIPVKWSRIKNDEGHSMVLPANWNTINFRIGMNLLFGNKSMKD